MYERWIALQPAVELAAWPQTKEEEDAYVEAIRSETPHSRLILEQARGNYLDVVNRYEEEAWDILG